MLGQRKGEKGPEERDDDPQDYKHPQVAKEGERDGEANKLHHVVNAEAVVVLSAGDEGIVALAQADRVVLERLHDLEDLDRCKHKRSNRNDYKRGEKVPYWGIRKKCLLSGLLLLQPVYQNDASRAVRE